MALGVRHVEIQYGRLWQLQFFHSLVSDVLLCWGKYIS